jgi:hypothetical protein
LDFTGFPLYYFVSLILIIEVKDDLGSTDDHNNVTELPRVTNITVPIWSEWSDKA